MLLKRKSILITGCCGFIGYHAAKKFLSKKFKVLGIDNLNNYYDIKLKKNRLKNLLIFNNFKFKKGNIANKKFLNKIFKENKFTYVLSLAAQAGVRYSINNPDTYLDNNINGFLNVLKNCKEYDVKHLVYASSSSVYGLNSTKKPFSTNDPASHPLAIYGVTKRTNELMAHSYSYLYNLPTTGLRYFTVYGPWGRPDMALFKFVSSILKNKRIELFNNGNHVRDFTYIDDAVELTYRSVIKIPNSSTAPWKIYNICSSRPVHLKRFIQVICKKLNKEKVLFKNIKMQQGDVIKTHGSNKVTIKDLRYKPRFNITNGIENFVKWYLEYFKIKKKYEKN